MILALPLQNRRRKRMHQEDPKRRELNMDFLALREALSQAEMILTFTPPPMNSSI